MESKTQEMLIREFYAQMTPTQKIGSELAAKMLGTSYVVEKTKGYLQWLKRYKHELATQQEQEHK